MKFLLYYKTLDTGQEIAEKLGISSGKKLPPDKRINTLIRWGNAQKKDVEFEINKAEAIRVAANKLNSLKIFMASGLQVPKFFSFEENYQQIGIPCIARKAKHSGGSGLWFCFSSEQLEEVKNEGADYVMEFVRPIQEWRVHIMGNKVAFVQKKYARNRNTSAYTGMHTFSSSWVEQVLDPKEAPTDVITQALLAVKVLGLDFGGVDVLENKEGAAYILEVNSAPVVRDDSLQIYVEYFKNLIEGR